MEYLIRTDKYGDVVPCDCCGCEVATGLFDWGPPYGERHDDSQRALCDFCSGSMAGNHTRYPLRDEFSSLRAEIWKAAAAVANYLEGKTKPDPERRA